MTRRLVKLTNITAVSADTTVTCTLPTNRIYHRNYFVLRTGAGAALANRATMGNVITEVRIKINGKVQRVFSIEQLFKIYGRNGVTFKDGILPVFYSEPWRREMEGEDALAWGTLDVDSFQIEFDIAATASSPRLEGFALVKEGVNVPLGAITKWKRRTVPIANVGDYDLTFANPKEGMFRLHAFEGTAGDIEAVDASIDGVNVYAASTVVNDAMFDDQDLVAQDGVFTIAFDQTQRLADVQMFRRALANGSVATTSEFRIVYTMGAANPFVLITEEFGVAD